MGRREPIQEQAPEQLGEHAHVQEEARPATKAELIGFFERLEAALDAAGFLQSVEKRPNMVRNLRNLFQRAELTGQEVRSLHGIVSTLTARRGRDDP